MCLFRQTCIADNLSRAGWTWGCVAAVDSQLRTIWIVDAHRGDGKRFVVRADQKLSAFVELESMIRAHHPWSFGCHRIRFRQWFLRSPQGDWIADAAETLSHASLKQRC